MYLNYWYLFFPWDVAYLPFFRRVYSLIPRTHTLTTTHLAYKQPYSRPCVHKHTQAHTQPQAATRTHKFTSTHKQTHSHKQQHAPIRSQAHTTTHTAYKQQHAPTRSHDQLCDNAAKHACMHLSSLGSCMHIYTVMHAIHWQVQLGPVVPLHVEF